jgi:uncharacterized protein YdeI (YjbR/CyaY-like superfamily)
MLKDSGLTVGDEAEVEIEFDPRARGVPIPPEFESALAVDPRLKAAFEDLTPSRRKEILQYLGSLKSKQALDRNIVKALKNLGRG